jgi:hypothetical protein
VSATAIASGARLARRRTVVGISLAVLLAIGALRRWVTRHDR